MKTGRAQQPLISFHSAVRQITLKDSADNETLLGFKDQFWPARRGLQCLIVILTTERERLKDYHTGLNERKTVNILSS